MTLWQPELPNMVQIEITSVCNLKCQMCPLTVGTTQSSIASGHMAYDLWAKIVHLASDAGEIVFGGFGETLANPKCQDMMSELNTLGVRMGMSTNGTTLTPKIAARLNELQMLTHINVSIDSPDHVIYRKVRGGELDKALRGLKTLMSAIDEPLRVTVSSVMMKENVASLADFPSILARVGVKRYVLQGMLDYNPELIEQNLFFHSTISKHMRAIREASQQAGIELMYTLPKRLELELSDPGAAQQMYYVHSPAEEEMTKQCTLPWESTFVDKDGNVFPCCYASTSRMALMGNMNEQDFATIWTNQTYQSFRKDLLHGIDTPLVCQTCTAVPSGQHPYRQYGAKLLLENSDINNGCKMQLLVQNTGTQPWKRDSLVRVATTRPRDRTSAYAHRSWISVNRVATFKEERVEPGQTATFEFLVTPNKTGANEQFQLVVDGVCWLPNTQFEITLPRTLRNLLSSFFPLLC